MVIYLFQRKHKQKDICPVSLIKHRLIQQDSKWFPTEETQYAVQETLYEMYRCVDCGEWHRSKEPLRLVNPLTRWTFKGEKVNHDYEYNNSHCWYCSTVWQSEG